MNIDIKDKSLLFCAKRNSGKSVLIKYVVSMFKDQFQQIFVICPSEEVNHFYQKEGFIPKENIFSEYHEDWVEKLISKLSKVNAGKPKDKLVRVLLILDDCYSDNNFHQSKSLKKLFTRGRHIGICIMVSAQYLHHIPPIARVNSDYVFSGQLNKQALDCMTEEYLSCGLTKEEFHRMYIELRMHKRLFIFNHK